MDPIDRSEGPLQYSALTLDCDRARQWAEFEGRFHQLRGTVIVAGPEGEAHDHFLRRLAVTLPDSHDADVIALNWPAWELESDADCDHALALGFPESATGDLARHIVARRSQTRKLVLITKTLSNLAIDKDRRRLETWFGYVRTVFEHVQRYSSESKRPPRWPLFVQPVSWPRQAWGGIANRVRLWGLTRPKALPNRTPAKSADDLEFVALPALRRITAREVVSFFDDRRLALDQRADLIATVSKAKNSEEILHHIERKLRPPP